MFKYSEIKKRKFKWFLPCCRQSPCLCNVVIALRQGNFCIVATNQFNIISKDLIPKSSQARDLMKGYTFPLKFAFWCQEVWIVPLSQSWAKGPQWQHIVNCDCSSGLLCLTYSSRIRFRNCATSVDIFRKWRPSGTNATFCTTKGISSFKV